MIRNSDVLLVKFAEAGELACKRILPSLNTMVKRSSVPVNGVAKLGVSRRLEP